MIVFDAPVNPVDQTAFVRRVPVPSTLGLSALFPTNVVATNKVALGEITKTNRTARFRSFDGRIHVADRDGYTDRTFELMPLSDSSNVGEYERIQIEYARLQGGNRAALVDAVYNDSVDLTRYVHNRMELAIGDVLLDGKFTPFEFGGNVELDFGVPAGNLITAGTLWTQTGTADIFGDLVAACDAYEAMNGERPGFVITSRKVARLLNSNTGLINLIKGAQTGVSRVGLEDVKNVFADEGIPTDIRVIETNLDVDGTTTRVLPDDRFILGPSSPADLLEIRYGLTATALELVNSGQVDMSFQQAAGIVGVVIKQGPPFRQFTFVDAVGQPILKDARKLMVLKVA